MPPGPAGRGGATAVRRGRPDSPGAGISDRLAPGFGFPMLREASDEAGEHPEKRAPCPSITDGRTGPDGATARAPETQRIAPQEVGMHHRSAMLPWRAFATTPGHPRRCSFSPSAGTGSPPAFQTTVASGTVGQGGSPPSPGGGFRLGSPPTYYDVVATATFSGSVTICFDYSGANCGNDNIVKLLHHEGTARTDLTASLDNVPAHSDAQAGAYQDIICGAVASLSPFLAAEANAAPAVTAIVLAAAPVPVITSVTMSAAFTDANPGDTHTANGTRDDAATSAGSVTESGATAFASASHYTAPGSPRRRAPACGAGAPRMAARRARHRSVSSRAYQKGATTPTGNTEFQFRAGGLTFRSTSYQWLVVPGARAQYKGQGEIAGATGSCGFLITAIDGALAGCGPDRFRIKLWDIAAGDVVDDNQMGQLEDADAATGPRRRQHRDPQVAAIHHRGTWGSFRPPGLPFTRSEPDTLAATRKPPRRVRPTESASVDVHWTLRPPRDHEQTHDVRVVRVDGRADPQRSERSVIHTASHIGDPACI